MFAYYFPPLGGGGVQRTLKNVKYLPEQGFEPIVVCGGQHGAVLKDPTLTSDVPPETVVLRAAALPFRQAQWKLDGLLRRAGLPTRLLNHLLWPDDLVGWLPGALWQGIFARTEDEPIPIAERRGYRPWSDAKARKLNRRDRRIRTYTRVEESYAADDQLQAA